MHTLSIKPNSKIFERKKYFQGKCPWPLNSIRYTMLRVFCYNLLYICKTYTILEFNLFFSPNQIEVFLVSVSSLLHNFYHILNKKIEMDSACDRKSTLKILTSNKKFKQILTTLQTSRTQFHNTLIRLRFNPVYFMQN